MDANHQDKTGSKLLATEDIKWVFNKKHKLWIPKQKKLTGFEDKTFWDRFQLIIQVIGAIILPISIVIGVWQFTTQQQNDLQKSVDQQQQNSLDTYVERMSDMLLTLKLGDSKPGDEVRRVAEARTLTVLQNLNSARKGVLIRFLYDAGLIYTKKYIIDKSAFNPIITLSGADLDNADLFNANLAYADLSRADLYQADLSFANLRGDDLTGAFLDNADLHHASLYEASLTAAFFTGTTMPDGSIHP